MTNKKLAESYEKIRLDPAQAERIWAAAEAAQINVSRAKPFQRAKKIVQTALIAAILSVFFMDVLPFLKTVHIIYGIFPPEKIA